MAFEDDVLRHAEQIKTRVAYVKGEEASKQALVVPFLQVLGYDVWDPREVQPEYIADFAKKKSNGQMEKIDYAIHLGGAPAIFIECKAADRDLDDHDAQLARYFNATPSVRVAILTNGIRLKVFTDLQQPNIMDDKPWLDVDLRTIKQAEIDALKRFRKADFAPDQIVGLAEEMVYYNVLVSFVAQQLRDPSEAFVRFVAGEIATIGRITAKIVERLTPILRKAIQTAIVEHVARSFNREPEAQPTEAPSAAPQQQPAAAQTLATPAGEAREGVVTTAEELEAFAIIAGIVREIIPEAAVSYRDSKSYFTIIQKNIRKWFVRLGVEKQPFWIAFRHVKVDEARKLAPGIEVSDGGAFGDCRFMIKTLSELNKLRAVILASYNAEAARVADDTEGNIDIAVSPDQPSSIDPRRAH
jgi:hypothetical protein